MILMATFSYYPTFWILVEMDWMEFYGLDGVEIKSITNWTDALPPRNPKKEEGNNPRAQKDSEDQSEHCCHREDRDYNFDMDDDFDADFGVGGALMVPREPVSERVETYQIAQDQDTLNVVVGHARVTAPYVFHDLAAPAILRQRLPVVDEETYDVDDLQNPNHQMISDDFDTNPLHAPEPFIAEQFNILRHREELRNALDMIGLTPDNQRSRVELYQERTQKFGEWFQITPLPFNNNEDWRT